MTLIPVNLTAAHEMFIAYLRAAKQQRIDIDLVEEKYQKKLDQLDFRMYQLNKLASAEMEEEVSPLLSTQLVEWAKKEALELILQHAAAYPNDPYANVDPDAPRLQQSFWNNLERQHQDLSSELLYLMQESRKQRARSEQEYKQSWQSVAFKSFENQQNQQQQFQNAAFGWIQGQQQMNQQWFQHQQEMFSRYQQSNQQWANVAMTGVQQAQLGVKQWYDFAAATQQTVENWMAGTEQRQAAVVEQAVHKANIKKWTTRLTIIGLVLVGIVSLFGCAFFAMMHLY